MKGKTVLLFKKHWYSHFKVKQASLWLKQLWCRNNLNFPDIVTLIYQHNFDTFLNQRKKTNKLIICKFSIVFCKMLHLLDSGQMKCNLLIGIHSVYTFWVHSVNYNPRWFHWCLWNFYVFFIKQKWKLDSVRY